MFELRTVRQLASEKPRTRDAAGLRDFFPNNWIALTLVMALCSTSAAQTFKNLAKFDKTNGQEPYAGLAQGIDGNFYGVTYYGGTNGEGTAFKITAAGGLSVLHNFGASSDDAAFPQGTLVLASNGNFYGTSVEGGASRAGTVFEMTPAGTATTIYSFCSETNCDDGRYPYAGVVQGTDGNFYGTTYEGGTSGEGTAFKLTPAGKLTVLHSFCVPAKASCSDGSNPYAGLVQGTDGNFYGATYNGGSEEGGTIFRISPSGAFTLLDTFNGTDQYFVYAALVQANSGELYGVSIDGGTYGNHTGGTVFQTSTAGKLSTLFNFDDTDGRNPEGPLVQGNDGNFYGTTYEGGNYKACSYGCGTLFKITSAGKLTTLHDFAVTDGYAQQAGMMQSTTGVFYGTTLSGGDSASPCNDNCGTVYSLSMGLAPFVRLLKSVGVEGSTVQILGQGFTGTKSVAFDGVDAKSFKAVSETYLTAIVPAGAKTGSLVVTTPTATLTSIRIFRVAPQITSFTPASGEVGTSVTITGAGLLQTTAVTFGGVKATTFKVVSDTEVTADIPTGAKTGLIAAVTPGGEAASKGTFTVTE
jgi:uncharacterized repeat protein (TIGR03803 family)